jgi:hypothetical protein
MTLPILPTLKSLPAHLPIDGAVRIELEEGVPIFRVTDGVQARIEELLDRQQDISLTQAEELELDSYEEIDDYLSFVNRTMRNLFVLEAQQAS